MEDCTERVCGLALADAAMSPDQATPPADANKPADAPGQGDATMAAGDAAARNVSMLEDGPTATYVLLADGAQFMSTPPSDDGSPPTTWLVGWHHRFHLLARCK
jgi:hypothetical protein